MNSSYILAGAAFALLLVPAKAEQCGNLISYGTLPLTRVPGHTSEFVPVEIAGVPKLMLLDTGAGATTITSAAARELNLKPTRSDDIVVDITGAHTTEIVSASLKIGGLSGDNVRFTLGTEYLSDFGDERIAGLLGADVLQRFDVSIDYGAHTFALLNQKHCDGQVVYWPERPLAVVPFKIKNGTEIFVEVTLDGKTIKAQLDTGASTSTLEKRTAERSFDLVLGSDDTPVAGDLGGQAGLTTWTHRFKSLSLAGLEISNPVVHIIPDKMSGQMNTWSTGSMLDAKAHSIDVAPMLLGMDVMKHVHLYIAFGEKKLYITPGGPAPPPPEEKAK